MVFVTTTHCLIIDFSGLGSVQQGRVVVVVVVVACAVVCGPALTFF